MTTDRLTEADAQAVVAAVSAFLERNIGRAVTVTRNETTFQVDYVGLDGGTYTEPNGSQRLELVVQVGPDRFTRRRTR